VRPPPGGTPQVSVAADAARLFQKTFPMQIPKLSHLFPSLSQSISSKICSFPDCLEIQHAALGSNTYLAGTYEEAAADELSLDHPVQGLTGWRKSLEQTEAGRIMLSKAMSSGCYERSLPDRYYEVIAIPTWQRCIYISVASTKKAIRSIPKALNISLRCCFSTKFLQTQCIYSNGSIGSRAIRFSMYVAPQLNFMLVHVVSTCKLSMATSFSNASNSNIL
jgi:hypothetical protein